MPPKIDTRKKTQKQKEKNKRRKKTEKARKRQLEQVNKEISGTGKSKSRKTTGKSRLKQSMKAPRGIVSNALARRMPLGTNYLRGSRVFATNGNFHSRALNHIRRVRQGKPLLQERYRMPMNIDIPRNLIQTVHPFHLVEDLPTFNAAFHRLPTASVPRGHKQTLLKEAVAVPVKVKTALAEPAPPNWGRMYEITERLQPRVMRAPTVSEMNKQETWRLRNAGRRTGNQIPHALAWAPSALRQNIQELTNGEITALIQINKEHLIPGPEVTGYDRYDAIQRARYVLEHGSQTHDSHETNQIREPVELTAEEIQGLIDMGLQQPLPIPGPHIQGEERREALNDLRSLLYTFGSNANSASQRQPSHPESIFFTPDHESAGASANANLDPLQLTDEEIQSLNLLGPIGQGYVQDATLSADQIRVRTAIENGRRLLRSQRNGPVPIQTGISYNSIQRNRSGSRSRSGSRPRSGYSSDSNNYHVNAPQTFILSGLTGIEMYNLSSFGQIGTDLIDATRVADPEAAEAARQAARDFLREHMP